MDRGVEGQVVGSLATTYMGLALRSPIVVGSSGLTNSVASIKRLEESGAGAVVLKSLFEEQILIETDAALAESTPHPEAADYLGYYVRENQLTDYLALIREAKASVGIPVIASISCITAGNWTRFAEEIEKAGADGLELNVFILPSDTAMTGDANEQVCFDVVRDVRARVGIPIALKLGCYYTNLANTLQRLSRTGVAALVLFNRWYAPDIDLDEETLIGGDPFSSPDDLAVSLRWIAVMAGDVDCDLAASTGIHDGPGVIKQILAGATVVQMVSAIYKHSPAVVRESLDDIEAWMAKRGYGSVADFRGKLSQSHIENPAFYERVQFLKRFGQI